MKSASGWRYSIGRLPGLCIETGDFRRLRDSRALLAFETRPYLLYPLAVSGQCVGSAWMIKKLLQAAIVAVSGLALGGCPLEQAKTTAPGKPAPADYQATVPPTPPPTNIRWPFYTPPDLTSHRSPLTHMPLTS